LRGRLNVSLFLFESLHAFSETNPYNFDADNSNFADLPVEGVSDFNQNYGIDENDGGIFYPVPSSLAVSNGIPCPR
jgi:hypothetical protein